MAKLTAQELQVRKNKLLRVMTGHIGAGSKIGMGELYEVVFNDGYQNRINDTKLLRRLITELRFDGVPIISSSARADGGYWLAAAGSELESYCENLKKHALKKLAQVANLKKTALPELVGQIRLELENSIVRSEMKCFICGSNESQWRMTYEKHLCKECWETIERLKIFREKISEERKHGSKRTGRAAPL